MSSERRYSLIGHTHGSDTITEANDLTLAVTWAPVPDAYITESSVTQWVTQTPWTSDIDGAGFGLDNIDRLEIQGASASDTMTFTVGGTNADLVFANTQAWVISGLTAVGSTRVQIEDGADLWVRDGGDVVWYDALNTEFAYAGHDGTNSIYTGSTNTQYHRFVSQYGLTVEGTTYAQIDAQVTSGTADYCQLSLYQTVDGTDVQFGISGSTAAYYPGDAWIYSLQDLVIDTASVTFLPAVTFSNGITATEFTDSTSGGTSTEWDLAYSWGDHSLQNYWDLDDAATTYAGLATFGDIVTLTSTNARLRLVQSDAAVNEGNWEWRADSGRIYLRALNDALTVESQVFNIQQSGGTVTDIGLQQPVTTASTLTMGGDINMGGNNLNAETTYQDIVGNHATVSGIRHICAGGQTGYTYFDTSNFGMLNSSGTWALRINQTTSDVDVYGTITMPNAHALYGDNLAGTPQQLAYVGADDKNYFAVDLADATHGPVAATGTLNLRYANIQQNGTDLDSVYAPAANNYALTTGDTFTGAVDFETGGSQHWGDGASAMPNNKYRAGTTVGGWARGWAYVDSTEATTFGGIGALGSNDTLTYFAIGFGSTWYNGDDGIKIDENAVTIDGTLETNNTVTVNAGAGGTGLFLDSTSSYVSGTFYAPGLRWREADGTSIAGIRGYVTGSGNNLAIGTGWLNNEFLLSGTQASFGASISYTLRVGGADIGDSSYVEIGKGYDTDSGIRWKRGTTTDSRVYVDNGEHLCFTTDEGNTLSTEFRWYNDGNLVAGMTNTGQIYQHPSLGDRLSLYDDRLGLVTMYGFGVESGTMYSKAVTTHRWYVGVNADSGTSESMHLDTSGLDVQGNITAVNASLISDRNDSGNAQCILDANTTANQCDLVYKVAGSLIGLLRYDPLAKQFVFQERSGASVNQAIFTNTTATFPGGVYASNIFSASTANARFGYNTASSTFTYDGDTVAQYGMSTFNEVAGGGVVTALSGFYGLRFFRGGALQGGNYSTGWEFGDDTAIDGNLELGAAGRIDTSSSHLYFDAAGTGFAWGHTNGDFYVENNIILNVNNHAIYFRDTGGTLEYGLRMDSNNIIHVGDAGEHLYVDSTACYVARGINGGYAMTNGSGTGTNWGGTIYGIGGAYDGLSSGSSYTTTGVYGIAWLRSTHASAKTPVGEGLYSYQNGVFHGGLGVNGIYTVNDLRTDAELLVYDSGGSAHCTMSTSAGGSLTMNLNQTAGDFKWQSNGTQGWFMDGSQALALTAQNGTYIDMNFLQIRDSVLNTYDISSTSTGVSANAVTCTYGTANSYEIDLEAATGNVTITVSGGPQSGNYGEMIIKVKQDSTANRTLTWAGGTFVWPGGTEVEPKTGSDAITIYYLSSWDAGTTWYINGVEYG